MLLNFMDFMIPYFKGDEKKNLHFENQIWLLKFNGVLYNKKTISVFYACADVYAIFYGNYTNVTQYKTLLWYAVIVLISIIGGPGGSMS